MTREHADDGRDAERQAAEDFASGAEQSDPGIVREFWDFLMCSKKWWLLPIIISLLVVGVLVMISGTAAAPFIYTLF